MFVTARVARVRKNSSVRRFGEALLGRVNTILTSAAVWFRRTRSWQMRREGRRGAGTARRRQACRNGSVTTTGAAFAK
jgi:hypothetical protein